MTSVEPTRRIMGPFNRVEGDLEVDLEIADGRVVSARVNAPLFRGFERILEGRPPLDALAIVPRICGICSISQSMAAATALRALSGVEPPRAGRLVSQCCHAVENLADHLSHFYLFFMPDFAREAYADRPWYDEIRRRFKAQSGEASARWLPARARLFHIVGLFAGKWPHTLAIQPGGATKAIDSSERLRASSALRDARRFIERELFGAPASELVSLQTAAELDAFCATRASADLGLFLQCASDLELDALGATDAPLLSVGAYELGQGPLFAAGIVEPGSPTVASPDFDRLSEDPTHSWLSGVSAHPFEGNTDPDLDRPGAYSWCKAPRLDGRPVEVGPLARQLVDRQPLVRDWVARRGRGVAARIVARLVEVARTLLALERWIAELEPGTPVFRDVALPAAGQSVGLVEAARGSLGHWLVVEDGRIARYQIVAPTTWNFSPRDGKAIPGPLEAALVGVAADPEGPSSVLVQHVVRSFDPCMACTVH